LIELYVHDHNEKVQRGVCERRQHLSVQARAVYVHEMSSVRVMPSMEIVLTMPAMPALSMSAGSRCAGKLDAIQYAASHNEAKGDLESGPHRLQRSDYHGWWV